MNKKILNDMGSALAEELVNQLNEGCVSHDGIIEILAPAVDDMFTLCNMVSGAGGIWIKDITISISYAAANIIQDAGTAFQLIGMPYGDWATHIAAGDEVVYFNREDFSAAANNIAGDQILRLADVSAGTEVGTFPMWIAAPNQLRFYMVSGEAFNISDIRVSIWCKPVQDTLTIPPSYLNKLRQFQTS